MEKKVKKKKNKAVKWVIVIVVLLVVIGGGIGACMHFVTNAMTAAPAAASAQEYVMHDMSDYIVTDGVVVSKNIDIVATSLPYPVKAINVELGDSVKKGDVICEIDTTEIDKNISKLEEQASDSDRLQAKQIEMSNHSLQSASRSQNASIAGAAKAVENARRAYNNAVKGKDALESVYNLALEEYEQAEAEYKELVKQAELASPSDAATALEVEIIQSARDQLDLQQIQAGAYSEMAAMLAAAYEERGDSIIIAEQDGLVTSINAVEGMPVSQGSIMQLEDDKNLRIEVTIKEKDIPKIMEGQEVNITSDTIADISAKGVVAKVYRFKANKVAAAGGTDYSSQTSVEATYRAIIDVTENNGLMLGMTARVEIVVDDIGDKMSVPYTSIIEEGNKKYVYVAKPAAEPGHYNPVKTEVQTGLNGVYYTEVTSGLESRDIVITYPEEVTEGVSITVMVKKNDEDKDSSEDESEDEE